MAFDQLVSAVMGGDSEQAQALCKQMLAQGTSAADLLNLGLVPAMERVGSGMDSGEFYLAEVIMAADTFKQVMGVLRPSFEAEAPEKLGTAVIGTIFGDIHDVGKNLVAIMWEASGFEVHDLGFDVPVDRFVNAVRQYNANLVGISAEITTTMIGMPKVLEALEEAGIRHRVKVLVGGPPLTTEYARAIGADGYGKDCFEAVVLAKTLLGK